MGFFENILSESENSKHQADFNCEIIFDMPTVAVHSRPCHEHGGKVLAQPSLICPGETDHMANLTFFRVSADSHPNNPPMMLSLRGGGPVEYQSALTSQSARVIL